MRHQNLSRIVSTLASVGLLLPATAFGASSWSAVSVNQWQEGIAPGQMSDLSQSADISTETWLGSQASARSSAHGDQTLWFVGKGKQSQELSVGARLNWADQAWPAAASAHTSAAVDQEQWAWSDHPITAHQQASFSQRDIVDGQQANADATASQHNTGSTHGDVRNNQEIAGQAHADGFVHPTWAHCGACSSAASFGGSVMQRVTVVVDNLFRF